MKRRRRRGYGRLQVWDLILWSGALLVLLPVLAVATSWWRPVDPAVTTHLRETLLGEYIGGSLALLMGVLLVAGSLGVSLAWMVARYRFPGDRLLAIALWLPLTVPGYVLAFVYSGLLEYSGPVATALRARGLNFDTDIRNFTGAVLVLSFALYPYVYLIMRTAFQSQGARFLEAGQSLGRDGPGLFFRLILPLSRPWLLTSLALVGMETMADFGAVSILGYDTFTTGIYKAWYGFFSPVTAARLASLLVVFVLTILLLEQWAERRKAFHQRPETALLPRRRPAPLRGWLMTAWGVLIVSLGFLVPLVQLLLWSVDSLQDYGWPAWLGPALGSSVVLGVLVGLAVVAGSFFLTMGERLSRVPPLVRRIPARLAMMGYALPGAVLAVGLYQAAGWFDQLRLAFIPDDQQTESWLLTGSVVLLVGGLEAVAADCPRARPSRYIALAQAWCWVASRPIR